MVQKAMGDGDQCTIIIDPKVPCDLVDCRLSCYSGYNGVGKCLELKKAPGQPFCVCTYNC